MHDESLDSSSLSTSFHYLCQIQSGVEHLGSLYCRLVYIGTTLRSPRVPPFSNPRQGILVIVFDCHPVNYFWTRTGDGHCLQPFIWQEIFAALNICSDIALLILPIPMVWALQVSRSQKISLSAIFLLGFLYVLC
jgi:hypothetical protein